MRDFVNLAHWDRILRVVLGLGMLTFGWLGLVPGLWAVAFQLFGWFPLATGIVGWCPFYVLVGVRTRASTAPKARRESRTEGVPAGRPPG